MKFRQKIKEAEELFLHGKYIEAVHFYNEILEDLPENHSAYYKRGHCYYRIREYDKALKDFNEAIRMCNKLDFYYGSRGSLNLAMNNNIAANDDFKTAISLNNSRDRHFYGLGRANMRLKKYQVAYDAFLNAEELGADVHWEMKANCLMLLGELEDSIALCDKEIINNPGTYRPYLKKGSCLHYLGWRQMEKFIQTEPLDLFNFVGAGREYVLEAIEVLSQAIAIEPDCEFAYLFRGKSYNLLFNYKSARNDFERAKEINPQNVETLILLKKSRTISS